MEMTKPGWELSDCELVDYSLKHVLYEIQMLRDTGLLLLDHKYFDEVKPEPVRRTMHFALIESFAMHARNLIDFFYPKKKPWDGDVLARYFFPGNQLPSTFPSLSLLPVLGDARRRASKQVGHLTTERISGQDWPVQKVLEDLRKVLLEFVRGASPSKIHSDLERFVTAWKVPSIFSAEVVNNSTCSPSSISVDFFSGF